MPQHLIRKLERFTRLSADDKRALEAAAGHREHRIGAHQDIVSEGDPPEHVNLILEGWACRYKQLEDGRRQIIAFFVPGDLFDIQAFVLREMDHSIGTLTPVRLAEIQQDALLRLADQHPRIARAFWWEAEVGVATAREWPGNLGPRPGLGRLEHRVCELYMRLRAGGLVEQDGWC